MHNQNENEITPDQAAGKEADTVADLSNILQPEPARRLRSCQRRNNVGLPKMPDLLKLAEVYLDVQIRIWPESIVAGFVPTKSPESIKEMSEAFTTAFQSGCPHLFSNAPKELPQCCGLATAYLRYSSENSNARSLDDQLASILKAARANDHFIPWVNVLADSSVSGAIAVRRGYVMAKDVLKRPSGGGSVEALYVYDISRASRDVIEMHKLARFARAHGKNILGAADSFDLSKPHADMQLMSMSMYSQTLLESVRHRVRAGMKGAVERGTSVGRAPFGYKLVPLLDSNGKEQISKGGRVLKVVAIDPAQRANVELAYKMFTQENNNYEEIRCLFNRLCVGGKNNWWAMDLRTLLRSPTYIGIHIFNKEHDIVDPETGKTTRKTRPSREWIVKKRPELRIVSDELWKAARRRSALIRSASPNAGQSPVARRRFYPKRLLSGILYCGYCDRPLSLAHSSATKHYYRCQNGFNRVSGCKLTCKNGVTVENAILTYVRENILSPKMVDQLLASSQSLLAEEAAVPKADLVPIMTELDEIKQALGNLTDAITGRSPHLMRSLVAKIEELEMRRNELLKTVRESQQTSAEPLPPLTAEDITHALDKIREVLAQSPAMATPVLLRLLGPIHVFAEKGQTPHRPKWVGKFGTNIVPLVAAQMQSFSKSPSPYHSDLQGLRRWTFQVSDTIPINQSSQAQLPLDHPRTKYTRLAPEVMSHVNAGKSFYWISRRLGVGAETVKKAYLFHISGKPAWVRAKGMAKDDLPLNSGKLLRSARRQAILQALEDRLTVLSDDLWSRVRVNLPFTPGRIDDRLVIEKILFAFRVGAPLEELKDYLVSNDAVRKRLRKWKSKGALSKLAEILFDGLPWLAEAEIHPNNKHLRGFMRAGLNSTAAQRARESLPPDVAA